MNPISTLRHDSLRLLFHPKTREATEQQRHIQEAWSSLKKDRSDLEASLRHLEAQQELLDRESTTWAVSRDAESARLSLEREALAARQAELETGERENGEAAARLEERTLALLVQEDSMAKREVRGS